MNWTPEATDKVLQERGYIVCIGQVPDTTRRHLEKRVRRGDLAKWRARWNAPFGGYGIGPLKTVYGLPHLSPEKGETK